MRELKFRFWNTEKKRWYGKGIHLHKVCYNVDNEEMHTNYVTEQFAGVLDSKGVDIYEGDIVKIVDDNWEQRHTYKVIYEPLFMAFVLDLERHHGEGDYIDFISDIEHYNIEVVGNIHQSR